MTELAIFEVLRGALWAAAMMALPILAATGAHLHSGNDAYLRAKDFGRRRRVLPVAWVHDAHLP